MSCLKMSPLFSRLIPAVVFLASAALSRTGFAQIDDAKGLALFEAKVRPVLVRYCYECHSAASVKVKGGLRLDSREGIRQGGESGPAVVPGDPESSLLIAAVRRDSLKMPPEKPLPDSAVRDLEEWIRRGATDPRDHAPDASAIANEAWEFQFAERRDWWSLRPVSKQSIPTVFDHGWPTCEIDRFVLASLVKHELRPAPRADRLTLIRRLRFALTGLPPSPEEVDAFMADLAPDAWEQLVDRLLSSPHFGEYWARHWMDVVRYTDTYGYEWDVPAKGAWRYRDYLVRAFNEDVPFDQLVREQIAGDLLDHPRINEHELINESIIGLMFYQMGEKRHGDSAEFNGIHQEMLDNKIDAFGKAFQATTLSCARCHDHKLDAVAQQEYYALAGVFMSSRWVTNTPDLPARQQSVRKEMGDLKAELRPLLASQWLEDLECRDSSPLFRKLRQSEAVRPGQTEEPEKEKAADPPLEDAWYPWFRMRQIPESALAEEWRKLSEQYAKERAQRVAKNVGHFTPIADFRQGIPPGWSVDGMGLSEITPCGDFTVALDGDAAIDQILHGGLYTNTLSSRLNGAVRTPWLNTLEPGHLSFEVCGGDFAARRTIVDNAFLTERQQYINHKHPAWQLVETLSSMRDRHIYIEFATKTSNPNFPPRVGLGGACSEAQAADPRSWFGITRVVRHNAPFTPADELARFTALFEGPPPTTRDEAARRYMAWFQGAVNAWRAGTPSDDHVRLLNWLLDAGLLTNRCDLSGSAEWNAEIHRTVDRYRQLEKSLSEPWTVNGMADLDPGFDYRLNIRGEYDQLGEPIPRGYLKVINEPGSLGSSGSGRRELADRIASDDNPLTARVFVNRVWHWLFGTGLVATPDDFGHAAEQPSHPELLDFLAGRFMAEGWSLKRLVKSIVLSETWRQSQSLDPQALDADPSNRLMHHYPVRRLDAESIRDAMLAASGRLEPQFFGPPVNPYRRNEDPQKRLFSGPLDGAGRRAIYTKVTIMEPPKFLATFNQPTPKIPSGKRDVTASPAQSLALLNDPFVDGQADYWASRLIERQGAVPDRIAHMFEQAFGRAPTPEETSRWVAAVLDLASAYELSPEKLMGSQAVWKDVAHAMFNAKEFIYVR